LADNYDTNLLSVLGLTSDLPMAGTGAGAKLASTVAMTRIDLPYFWQMMTKLTSFAFSGLPRDLLIVAGAETWLTEAVATTKGDYFFGI